MFKQLNSGLKISIVFTFFTASLLCKNLGAAPLVGDVTGLTLLIKFQDTPDSELISPNEINDFLNLEGYSNFGNHGSVKDYFLDVSNNNLNYTNVVTDYYYEAELDKASYLDGSKWDALIIAALDDYIARGNNLSALTTVSSEIANNDSPTLDDDREYILAISAFYTGSRLLPGGAFKAAFQEKKEYDGAYLSQYQVSPMGENMELSLGIFCHETAHLLFKWPDITVGGGTGIGNYGLMGLGLYGGNGKNPVPPNPYLRSLAGWEEVTELNSSDEIILTHESNSNTSFKYTNKNNTNEHYWIESRTKTGRNSGLPDEGLLIWHVITDGNIRVPSNQISLVQADGLKQLEDSMKTGEISGDENDLFDADSFSEFTPDTNPNSNWLEDGPSGLNIFAVSPIPNESGNTPIMTFRFIGAAADSLNKVSAEFILQSDWGAGYCGELIVSNNALMSTTNWTVIFDTFGAEIYTSWNLNPSVLSGEVEVTGTGSWNSVIREGGTTYSLGFCANRSEGSALPSIKSVAAEF